jgi:DNA-binding NarL/FixJ family response regulator
MRILLADDFEVVRTGLKNLLSPNWEVCGEAENGLKAVEKAVELTPDVVVLDITMPVMNGFDAAREIRRLAPKTKIVMFSMHDSARMADEAKEAGADAFIVKSSGIEEIEKAIGELMGTQIPDSQSARLQ